MNTIEKIITPTDKGIDLHIDLPEGWENWNIKVVIAFDKTDEPVKKHGTGLSRLAGVLAHLTPKQHAEMDRQFDELRNEWERDILR